MSNLNIQVKANKTAPAMPEQLIKEAIKLFKIKSTIRNEKLISMYICDLFDKTRIKYEIDDLGNILVIKGKSLFYPCFCCHLDTVHSYPNGFNVFLQKNKDRDYLYSSDDKKNPVGIGGDDKCGIFVCLYLLQKIDNIKIVFFSGEESGGTGSCEIDKKFFDDCKYIAGIDRWNGHDFINSYSGNKTISKELIKAVKSILSKFDYSLNAGLFTDVFNLMSRGINLSCFNLSCGYYSHHSREEFVDLNELYNCCLLCMELCKLPDVYKFIYSKFNFSRSYWHDENYNYKDKYKKHDYNSSLFEGVEYCVYCGIELIQGEETFCHECRRYAEKNDNFENDRPKYNY